MYSEILKKAVQLASFAHKEQKRKTLNYPYISHPLMVMHLCSQYSQNQELLAAAVLHDVVEDCGVGLDGIKKEFGLYVFYLVDLMSEDKSLPYRERKEKYFSRIFAENNKDIFLIKSADILYNLNDILESAKYSSIDSWVSYVDQCYDVVLEFSKLWNQNPFLNKIFLSIEKLRLYFEGSEVLEKTSCGIIPFFVNEKGEREYLLVQLHHGAISFPKGHVEQGESFLQTAERELFEETGLSAKIISGHVFSEEYLIKKTNKKIHKSVYYFLGQVGKQELKIQEEEIKNFFWLPYEKAVDKINHKESRNVLIDAHAKS